MKSYINQANHSALLSHRQLGQLLDGKAEVFEKGDAGIVLLDADLRCLYQDYFSLEGAEVAAFVDHAIDDFVDLLFLEDVLQIASSSPKMLHSITPVRLPISNVSTEDSMPFLFKKVFSGLSDRIRPKITQFSIPTYRLRISVYSLLCFRRSGIFSIGPAFGSSYTCILLGRLSPLLPYSLALRWLLVPFRFFSFSLLTLAF